MVHLLRIIERMDMRKAFLLGLLLITLTTGCRTDLSPSGRQIFLHEGKEREYLFYRPDSLPAGAPLLMVLHGFTSSAEIIRDYSGFNQLADEHHFAVVYPQGLKDNQGNTFWKVGYEFHDSLAIDDLGFLSRLLEYLQQEFTLSKSNAFALGMSNGGEMAYLLACYRPTIFRAIATVAATMMNVHFEQCQPGKQVPLLSIFGTADQTTNYYGDEENRDGWGAYKSIPEVIDFWASQINYDTLIRDSLKDIDTRDNSFVIRESYQNTGTAQEFLFYKVIGGDHDWPGAWGNKDIHASKLIWSYFAKSMGTN